MADATLTRQLGTAQAAAPVLIGGVGAMLVTLLLRTNAELRAARAAVARMAVEQERARLARDLHDLLGHNLSFLAVKLELARRLVGRADHPAAVELEEAHRMARSALRDVREAVGGYRQPTLEGELAGARLALEAAGIGLVVHDEHGVLSSEVEAACAWVVREGVTNVIEHSGARACRIDIRRVDGSLTATIAEDGTGGDVRPGMGLKGLEERVRAGRHLVGAPVALRRRLPAGGTHPGREHEGGGAWPRLASCSPTIRRCSAALYGDRWSGRGTSWSSRKWPRATGSWSPPWRRGPTLRW